MNLYKVMFDSNLAIIYYVVAKNFSEAEFKAIIKLKLNDCDRMNLNIISIDLIEEEKNLAI